MTFDERLGLEKEAPSQSGDTWNFHSFNISQIPEVVLISRISLGRMLIYIKLSLSYTVHMSSRNDRINAVEGAVVKTQTNLDQITASWWPTLLV